MVHYESKGLNAVVYCKAIIFLSFHCLVLWVYFVYDQLKKGYLGMSPNHYQWRHSVTPWVKK
jgi:hypothetical protein